MTLQRKNWMENLLLRRKNGRGILQWSTKAGPQAETVAKVLLVLVQMLLLLLLLVLLLLELRH